ncbi:MAG TPA: hypothetical protein PKD09_18545 [Aggregatilinea sp.]|uniref:hypothetical protein n=1 Tax=Aggregatilinea sp. TaxID=2806333 RepID=UPI002C34A5F0|nr:hypothetical protein [Aggregatilinea sp.]HML23662.1 hypothetical protein [Aggregatilinea sp.]
MIRALFGIFLVLHGVVHLLYLGQSQRVFELQPGMVWPDGAWLSRSVGVGSLRTGASVALGVAALGFAAAGIALLAGQDWWRPVTVGAGVFSAAVYLALWDGTARRLDNQGGVGLLIDLALVAMALLRWPDFGL